MSALPSVRASLAERYLFNFRLPADAMSRYLPVSWLVPQPVNGYGVVSFCVLDLRNITVAPLPAVAGLASLNCAPRYAVLDLSQPSPAPAVYVTERQTNSAFGAWLTLMGCPAPHPYVEVDVGREDDRVTLRVSGRDGGPLFSASVRPAETFASELFPSLEAFTGFIAQGVTSNGRSKHPGRLTKVDLHKEDAAYEPLSALEVSGSLVDDWYGGGAVLDSAFFTSGGRYEWTYQGLIPNR
jgi:hypothetical protein